MYRAQETGAKIIFEAGDQTRGDEPAAGQHDAYAAAFTDSDGYVWQVSRPESVGSTSGSSLRYVYV